MIDPHIREGAVAGNCDGVKGQDAYGWAWHPDYPDVPVTVEMWIDGALHSDTIASLYRPDLRAAGVGHGRYGWRIPVVIDPNRVEPLHVVVRAKGGELLRGGEFEIRGPASEGALDDPDLEAFVAALLGRTSAARAPQRPEAAIKTHFLLHCAGRSAADALGAPEYSYAFVMKAFAPLLAKIGHVHYVEDPVAGADTIYADNIAKGEASILLSFAPPHRLILGLRCPVISIIAWEFPTIPERVWAGDLRHDWRFVLRQTGRCITLSHFAAAAVRATMGDNFPVKAIPAPVFDRFVGLQSLSAPPASTDVEVQGFVFETRNRTFEPGVASPPLPVWGDESGPGEILPTKVSLSGIVFTAVFSPKDGRKNWSDIVTAFVDAHRATPDATLVLKMVGNDPALWWWELHDILGRLPPFACRIVIIHGYLDEEGYNTLISASHWAVNASRAEGLCLPLVEFMSAGRPAIAPRHTAMLDYIDDAVALVVKSDEEFCGFPHDPENEMTTTRHRISWSALGEAFACGFRLSTTEPARYNDMAEAARAAMMRFCSDSTVSRQLDSFLGLNSAAHENVAAASELLKAIRA